MAYIPVALPEETPALVQELIRGAVEPFLRDTHAMLRLPIPQESIDAGCNLSIAQVLFAAIGGVSAVIYATSGGTGKAFQDFLTQCYPWDSEPKRENLVAGAEAARILYEEYRNPLTHSAGTPVFSVPGESRREFMPKQHTVRIDRVAFSTHAGQGIPENRICELELEPVRPSWLPVTLASDAQQRVLTVESLYWGFRKSLWTLCFDTERMQTAVRFFAKAP